MPVPSTFSRDRSENKGFQQLIVSSSVKYIVKFLFNILSIPIIRPNFLFEISPVLIEKNSNHFHYYTKEGGRGLETKLVVENGGVPKGNGTVQ